MFDKQTFQIMSDMNVWGHAFPFSIGIVFPLALGKKTLKVGPGRPLHHEEMHCMTKWYSDEKKFATIDKITPTK